MDAWWYLRMLRWCAQRSRVGLGRCARRARSHPLIAGALALAVCLAAWWVGGVALQSWAIGLGMDEQRASLIASLIVVLGGAAAASLALGHPAATRAGSLLALCAMEIGPFLVGSAHTPATPGLTQRVVPGGWVAQPLGMLLLGAIAATSGSAVGMLLRSDVGRLWARLRRRRLLWLALLPALAAAVVGANAASTALQDGPLADLYTYATGPVQVANPAPQGGGSLRHELGPDGRPDEGRHEDGEHGLARSSAVSAVHHVHLLGVGQLDPVTVDGHQVDVYLPAAYASEPSASFPVVYFLHGFPGTQTQWLTGGQLPAVLDQLIDDGVIPPMIAVLPDGDGQPNADSEWGDTSSGGAIEDWLIDQVIPSIDSHYRTLGAKYRGIAGLSSGGFGAVNLALRHPDLFSWAASYSGFFQARRDLFGSDADDNSPAVTAPKLSDTERMPLFIGVGTIDREFISANRKFVSELHELGWAPLRTETVPGGHGWEAWRQQLVDSLDWLGHLWSPGHQHTAPVA